MEKTIIALLPFFVVSAYTNPSYPEGPYEIAIANKYNDDVVGYPCFLLKMKVQNNKRSLGLGTCCDQDKWKSDFRTVKRQAGYTTKLKIMSNDSKYVLTNKLEFKNATSQDVYFKTGKTSHLDRILLKTMSSPIKFLSADNDSKKVKLVPLKSSTTSFTITNSSSPNSACNEIFNLLPKKIYCDLIKNKMNCN